MNQQTLKQTYVSHTSTADAVTWAGLILAVVAGASAALAGLGSRWGVWYFMTGFSILRVAAIAGLAAAVISLIGGIATRNEHRLSPFIVAAAGILIGLVTAGIPWSWLRTAEAMPAIHDISTDTVNPPAFVAIMPLRQNAENPVRYEGEKVAVLQHNAYPDIRPLILPVAPAVVFSQAVRIAQNMGWQIVATSPKEGRFEAMARTFWFGFTDDVVVRIAPVQGGSRVDIRSVSRVGDGDVGTNAQRVRAFLHKLGDSSIVDTNYTTFDAGY